MHEKKLQFSKPVIECPVQQIVGEEEVILEIMEFVDYLSKLTCHR
jgi:hypothetical protein